MTVNERDSRVAVVHRCFSEGGDSIKCLLLAVFASEAARQLINEFLWLSNWRSHTISQDVHVRVSADRHQIFKNIFIHAQPWTQGIYKCI